MARRYTGIPGIFGGDVGITSMFLYWRTKSTGRLVYKTGPARCLFFLFWPFFFEIVVYICKNDRTYDDRESER